MYARMLGYITEKVSGSCYEEMVCFGNLEAKINNLSN